MDGIKIMATFTVDELRQIFKAGVKQGQEEATSYDWGKADHCWDTDKAFFEAVRDALIARKGGEWVECEIVEALIGKKG